MDIFSIAKCAIPHHGFVMVAVVASSAIVGCDASSTKTPNMVAPKTPATAEVAEYPDSILLETSSSAGSASFSGDGTRLLVVEQGGSTRKGAFQVWDTRTGKPVGPRIHHGTWCLDATLNDAGSVLFIESQLAMPGPREGEFLDRDDPEMDATLWDVQMGKMSGPPFRHGAKSITDAAISPDWRMVATCNASDPHVHLWDLRTGRLLSSIEDLGVFLLQFDRSGERLITVGECVRVWNVHTAKLEHEFAKAHWAPLGYVRPALSRNGRIAVGTWSGINVHDLATGKLIASPTLKGYYRSGTSENVQCNRRMDIVTVKMETELFALDLQNMTQLKTPELGPGHFALSPRDAVIAIHSSQNSGLWDLRSGEFIARQRFGNGFQGRWNDATFDGQGDRLAIVTENGTEIVKMPEGPDARK